MSNAPLGAASPLAQNEDTICMHAEEFQRKQETTLNNTHSVGGAKKLRDQEMQAYLLDTTIQLSQIWLTLPHQLLGNCSAQRSITSRVLLLEWLLPLVVHFLMLWRISLDCQVSKGQFLHLYLWRHHISPSCLIQQQLMLILRRPRTFFLSTVLRVHKTSSSTRLSLLWLEIPSLEPFGARFFSTCLLILKSFSLQWTWAMITMMTSTLHSPPESERTPLGH